MGKWQPACGLLDRSFGGATKKAPKERGPRINVHSRLSADSAALSSRVLTDGRSHHVEAYPSRPIIGAAKKVCCTGITRRHTACTEYGYASGMALEPSTKRITCATTDLGESGAGRYGGIVATDVSEIKIIFSIPPHRPTPNFPPSWKAAPTNLLLVVRYDREVGERSLDLSSY